MSAPVDRHEACGEADLQQQRQRRQRSSRTASNGTSDVELHGAGRGVKDSLSQTERLTALLLWATGSIVVVRNIAGSAAEIEWLRGCQRHPLGRWSGHAHHSLMRMRVEE